MKKNKIVITALVVSLSLLQACSKTDFLDAKPNQSLVVPTTLDDFQAILDMDLIMNGAPNGQGLVPQLGEIGTDDYSIVEDHYNTRLTDAYRRYHIWDPEANTAEPLYDWENPYRCVFYANVVLDGLEAMEEGSYGKDEWGNLKGAALFYRAHALYQLAQVFAYPYGQQEMVRYGIPLRFSSDISEVITRSTVEETHAQIIADLREASAMLPDIVSIKERPSKAAAFALLARVFLSMRDYDNALLSADASLAISDRLLDYNDLNPAANFPFLNSGIMESEVLFKSTFVSQPGITSPVNTFVAKIDEALLESYDQDDLRHDIFYRTASPSGWRYKGSFYGSNNYFAGIATDEVYLTKIECLARLDKFDEALDLLEKFRRKRFVSTSGRYRVPNNVRDNKEDLINFIKEERRRQLPFRGLRWTDIRRYNLEGDGITLSRNIANQNFVLAPNDNRYAYLIPYLIIGFNGMEQNPR
ncbi:RagB/SusD family nutrient uptake outer membrane protein [Sphingobacterium chuzhouense]|uniref:RagB/SusD family nutrient uptake outer membrane protein n=1 Tax=Sphingobacterium chuzhouense TaxID=1742264 RepID=A0ABR7XPX5_9SPHI|nr:RagB/SusD family nutrient uptake outer membrane protein [Sphingobacterium chuzhouense]MBD1421226.1 RagB/SusD family nutrient uptake outer membrane protein [Sphingobacterium chuzhouense]